MCYRTGDLAWFNISNGQFEFRGCRDDQLKLRYHSIDFEDVRSVLKEMVTNCVVVKSKLIDIDYLVAYVQTTYSVRQVRQHCLTHLPSYLVPSVFMIVDDLPIDQYGATDLPLSDLTSFLKVSNMEKRPATNVEERVRQIWYEALPHIDSIPSMYTSFFALGDDPGSFIRLFHLYSINFTHILPITAFLKQPTIAEHVRLLLEKSSVKVSFFERSHSTIVTEGKYQL